MPENEMENAIKIAVIGEQLTGIREQQKAHNETTTASITEVKASIAQVALDQKTSNTETNKKLDDLTAIMNRGRGAFAASMVIAGGLGAIVLAIIEGLSHLFRKGP